jgi:hypothetical protein
LDEVIQFFLNVSCILVRKSNEIIPSGEETSFIKNSSTAIVAVIYCENLKLRQKRSGDLLGVVHTHYEI